MFVPRSSASRDTPPFQPADPPCIVHTPIGDGYCVPTSFFLDNVLPPLLPDIDIEALLKKVKVITQNDRLWGYKDTGPAGKLKEDVKKAFAALVRDVHLAVEAVKAVKKTEPTLFFCNNKEGKADFDNRSSRSLPDAFFLPVPMKSGFIQWTDLAAFGEYRKKASADDTQENIEKISQSLSSCIRNDPRRRFVYGFTAEDEHMRLWYCDRSQIVVSESFNFVQDYCSTFQFVLSLSFAEPHQLGWDPTMAAIRKDGQVRYDITVRSAEAEAIVYRTLQILSENGSRRALGRGTRVWKAIRLVDGEETGQPVALKDVWVDSHREREGDIHSQVMQADYIAKEHLDLRKYFISIQTHGDVFISDAPDQTPVFLLFDETSDTLLVHERHPKSTSSAIVSARSQTHYRIVYTEVGQPLSEANSLQTIFKALEDVVHGVRGMHRSGWVHRDLSTGNIIIVDGIAKLTDLEYAIPETRQERPDRTGTPFFVAVEVDRRIYLFRPFYKIPSSVRKRRIQQLQDAIKSKTDISTLEFDNGAPPEYEFRYNPLHDLESIWWIAVYFVVNREAKVASTSHDTASAQRQVAHELFYDCDKRHAALIAHDNLSDKLRCLHPSLVHITPILDDLRILLCNAYTDAEVSIPSITFKLAIDIYDHMCGRFAEAMELSQENNIEVFRFDSGPPNYVTF